MNSTSDERGAAMVEFAVVLPLLLLFLFAIVEFGWGFTQHLDVRHGARETARLTAVNVNPGGQPPATQAYGIAALGCDRLEHATGATVQIVFDDPSATNVGDLAEVTVTRDFEQLTGYLGPIFDGMTLTSVIEFRLEQDATWDAMVSAYPCP